MNGRLCVPFVPQRGGSSYTFGAFTMIRQEIVHLRVCAVIRSYDPATPERCAFKCPVIIYQRTCVTCGFVVVVSAHLDLRTVGKMGVIQSTVAFGINHCWQVKKIIRNIIICLNLSKIFLFGRIYDLLSERSYYSPLII